MYSINDFEKILGYTFKNKYLIYTALTHSSFANETGKSCDNYERLEFLGDSVLGMITSEYIFKKFNKLPEGKLTRLRSSLVCEKTLKIFAQKLQIGKFLRLSHGEERSGGRERPSILADAFESVVAATFLDGGIEPAKEIVLRFITNELGEMYEIANDYKTEIQEVMQASGKHREIKYNLINETGPDHNKSFTIELLVQGIRAGIGTAGSKKEAEQMAAKDALEHSIKRRNRSAIIQ